MAMVWGCRRGVLLGAWVVISGCAGVAPRLEGVRSAEIVTSPSLGAGDAIGRQAFGEALPEGVIMLGPKIRDATAREH